MDRDDAPPTPATAPRLLAPRLRSDLTNEDRIHVVCRVWGENHRMNLRELMVRCSDVAEVDCGLPVPSMSRRDREAVEAAILELRAEGHGQ